MPEKPRLSIRAFTHDPVVSNEIARLKSDAQTKRVSDVFDANGNQYVDLVMEGGGVLGIALVGYCYALESIGIRFHSVAGTSAGAINALFLQAVAPPGQKKSRSLIREITAMPVAEFQDGGIDARRAIDALLSGDTLLLKLARLLPNLPELMARQGINPGTVFHNWAQQRLAHYSVGTLKDLQVKLNTRPRGLVYRNPATKQREAHPWDARLALITTELGTARKVVFPQDTGLFYATPAKASPADFVRASMSVPYFFEPFRIAPLPRGAEARKLWKSFKPRGPVPREAVFVDGGLLSNFPIREFHRQDGGKPTMPTFGVKLGVDSGVVRNIDRLGSFTGALIDAMRFDADREFLYENPDYRQLIAEIRTDGYHWLDFNQSDDEKIGLFREGVIAARRFIEGFDWPAYRASR